MVALALGWSAASVVMAEQPASLPAESAEPAAEARVSEIAIEGLKSRTPEQVIQGLATKVGQPYNALLVREDLGRLSEIMQRVSYRVEQQEANAIKIVFAVEEFPRLRNMQPVGNVKLTNDRLNEIAKLKAGDTLDARTLKSLRNAIKEEYRNLGMPQARVDASLTPIPPAEGAPADAMPEADLQIIVQEGVETLVDDLNIEGNKAFSTIRLKSHLQTKGSWLFIKNYYDDDAFESDLADLKNFYVSQGYFDVTVERGPFKEGTKRGKKTLSPTILINEGGTYTLRSVDVRGARLFSRDEILSPFKSLVGKTYGGDAASRAMNDARDLYLNGGFLTAEIKPDYHFDASSRSVDLTLQVTEQERIYVGKIKIQRPNYKEDENPTAFRRFYNKVAPQISDEAVLREVLLTPGEVYSKERERDSLYRLDRLGVFADEEGKSAVKITNQPTENPRVHDALIELQDGVSGHFGGGVGYGDVAGLFGFLFIEERNLFGEARDLRAQLQIGTLASNATISYLDRHYKGTNDSLGVSLYYTTLNRSGYTENAVGASAEVTRKLYSGWDRAIRGRVEYVNLSEASGIDADEDLDANYPVITGRLAFREDTRYPFRAPREGRMLYGGIEAGVAGGPLLKFTGEGEFYRPLTRRLTYRVKPSFGLLPYNSDSVGLTERLFLGGGEDLRGFAVRGAGRRDSEEDEVGVGGAAKILVRNELLFPIYDPVSGVFFVDAGVLGGTPFSYEMPRVSTGLGGRIDIRRATIAVDFALPLLRQSGDQTQFMHISFKSSF